MNDRLFLKELDSKKEMTDQEMFGITLGHSLPRSLKKSIKEVEPEFAKNSYSIILNALTIAIIDTIYDNADPDDYEKIAHLVYVSISKTLHKNNRVKER